MSGNFYLAFLMCLIAGLSTGIGSLAFLLKRNNRNFLAAALGFSAGVMIYVSFVEIFTKAQHNLTLEFGKTKGSTITVVSFFAGFTFVVLVNLIFTLSQNYINKKKSARGESADFQNETSLMQNQENLSLNPSVDARNSKKAENKLLKSGLLTAIAMAVHNFPEGLATFISAYHDTGFALTIVLAISIHNIPEGIAVSVPVYYATKSKKKAFLISFASGLAEPIGAIIGYFALLNLFSQSLYGVLFAAVAGMMICISVGELLPSAREYSVKYCSIGFAAGMIVIAVSLLLFL